MHGSARHAWHSGVPSVPAQAGRAPRRWPPPLTGGLSGGPRGARPSGAAPVLRPESSSFAVLLRTARCVAGRRRPLSRRPSDHGLGAPAGKATVEKLMTSASPAFGTRPALRPERHRDRSGASRGPTRARWDHSAAASPRVTARARRMDRACSDADQGLAERRWPATRVRRPGSSACHGRRSTSDSCAVAGRARRPILDPFAYRRRRHGPSQWTAPSRGRQPGRLLDEVAVDRALV